MFQAMTEGNKSLDHITVRELCETAGINRSSFYAHYRDVFDVMERVEATMAKGLTEAFLEKLNSGADIGGCFEALFSYIGEYRSFYAFYFGQSRGPGVIGVAWELLQDRLARVDYREYGYQTEEELSYHGEFFLFGLTAMLRRWVNNGCPESPHELYGILCRQYSPDTRLFLWGEK